MKETGRILKERRENLGVSVAEVSIATKITPRMLQAIEAAEMSYLPARTFLRGFVKSYSQFLKMDVDKTLKEFNDEMNALEPKPTISEPEAHAVEKAAILSPPPERAKSTSDLSPTRSVGKQVSAAIGLIVLLGCIYFVRELVQKYEREGTVDANATNLEVLEPVVETKPSENVKPSESANKPTEAAKETPVAPTAEVSATPETAEAPKATESEKATVTAKAIETIKATETPKATEIVKAEETPKAVETPKPAAANPGAESHKAPEPAKVVQPAIATTAPKATEAATATEKVKVPTTAAVPEKTKKGVVQEVIIEALDKVEVQIKLVNGEDKKITLTPSQVHTIKTAGAFSLDISDGGAVNIIYNGRDVGVPGDLGRPKKIQFP